MKKVDFFVVRVYNNIKIRKQIKKGIDDYDR